MGRVWPYNRVILVCFLFLNGDILQEPIRLSYNGDRGGFILNEKDMKDTLRPLLQSRGGNRVMEYIYSNSFKTTRCRNSESNRCPLVVLKSYPLDNCWTQRISISMVLSVPEVNPTLFSKDTKLISNNYCKKTQKKKL